MTGPNNIAPILLSAVDAAQVLGIGRTLFCELDTSGRLPQAIRLGKRKLWRYDELNQWTRNGCPPRDRWEYDPER